MKVVANTYLNARVGKPSTMAANPSWLSPGDSIDIDAAVLGDTIEGNSIWYRATDNCYYWSGGIENTAFLLPGSAYDTLPVKTATAIAINLKNHVFNDFYKRKLITGMGVGIKNDEKNNRICLVFFVEEKLPQGDPGNLIPAEFIFRGFRIPTDVKVSGQSITHQYDPNNRDKWVRADKDTPVHCGGGLLNSRGERCGTRTLKIEKDGKIHLLTCMHVAAPARIIDNNEYFFPDLSSLTLRLSPNNRTFPLNRGAISLDFDYALADIPGDAMDNRFPHPDFLLADIKGYYKKEELQTGMIIYSFGAISGPQTGEIKDISVDEDLYSLRTKRSYKNLVRTTKISVPGDSGAPVLGADGRLIGYVVGGTRAGIPASRACSYLIAWYVLADNLNFKIL